jgi:peroxiredoxin Q/BCP
MQRKQWRSLALAALLSIALLGLGASHALALQVGDKAPDFALPATTAEAIKLADYMGKKPVVVFFYVYAFSNA